MTSPRETRATPRERSSGRRSSPAGSRAGNSSASTATVSAPAPSTISASAGRRASGGSASVSSWKGSSQVCVSPGPGRWVEASGPSVQGMPWMPPPGSCVIACAPTALGRNGTRGSRSSTWRRSAASTAPVARGAGTRSRVPVETGRQSRSRWVYASAARSVRKSVSGPGAVWRRVGSRGKLAMSRAGRPRGSSVGVGAWTTGAVRGRTGSPSGPTGTAQVTDQWGRWRSSTGRSASSRASRPPPVRVTRQRVVGSPARAVSSTRVYGPSVRRVRVRGGASGVSTTISVRPGSVRSSASSTPASRRSVRSRAAASRRGRTTTVS